jgi:hypothetical protein
MKKTSSRLRRLNECTFQILNSCNYRTPLLLFPDEAARYF